MPLWQRFLVTVIAMAVASLVVGWIWRALARVRQRAAAASRS